MQKPAGRNGETHGPQQSARSVTSAARAARRRWRATKVYVTGKWGKVMCLTRNTGKNVWQRNVTKEDGVRVPAWGFNGSVLVQGERVLLNAGAGGMALDRRTGRARQACPVFGSIFASSLPTGKIPSGPGGTTPLETRGQRDTVRPPSLRRADHRQDACLG